jgi:hypothetical protein
VTITELSSLELLLNENRVFVARALDRLSTQPSTILTPGSQADQLSSTARIGSRDGDVGATGHSRLADRYHRGGTFSSRKAVTSSRLA